MPEEKEVECPECQTKLLIYSPNPANTGVCHKCGMNVQAVYERARHERALKKVMEPTAPTKKTPSNDDPFSFKM